MIFHSAMRWSGLALYGVGILTVSFAVADHALTAAFRMAAVLGAFVAFVGGALWGFHQR